MKFLKEKNPNFDFDVKERTNKDGEQEFYFELPPQTGVNIPSGFYTSIPKNVALTGFNKSGVATKKNFMVGACVDDHSYQGILHLHVINVGNTPQEIVFDEKLVQFVPLKIDVSGVKVFDWSYPKDKFFKKKSKRGAGGFGSSGLK
jgi:dUTPase